MKHRNGMDKLRNKVVGYFIVITLICGLLNHLLDLFSLWLEQHIINSSTSAYFIGLLLAGMTVLIYIASGLCFFIITKKAIEKENKRQILENNLIYAAVAHDLKTPITSIQGFSKALVDGKIPEDEIKETCDIIYRKSKSMNDLVDIMSEYAQLGAEEYKPNFTGIDICSAVRDIIAEHYCNLEEHHITLELDIPDTPVMIWADKREFSRAVTNLIINSYKHNPEGIRLFVQIRKENAACILFIADNGNEIPEGMKIFEPFVTDNASRTSGHGTGLGLAITKRVIEKHNGTITLERNPQGYTKAFVITLNCTQTSS